MTNSEPRWLDRAAAAAYLGITPHQLSRLVTLHQVPVLRINRRTVRFDAIAMAALEQAVRIERGPGDYRETLPPRAPDGHPVLTVETVIEQSSPMDTLAAVYFLIRDGRVVYVGQSINVFQRLDEHRKKKRFDRFFLLACPIDKLRAVEAFYIATFQPEENFEVKERLPYHWMEQRWKAPSNAQ